MYKKFFSSLVRMKLPERTQNLVTYVLLIFSTLPLLVTANSDGKSHQWGGAYILVLCLFFLLVGATTAYLVHKFGCHITCTTRSDNESQTGQRVVEARGLDVKEVEAFPTMSLLEVKSLRGFGKVVDQLECAVCLSEFKDDDILRLLPGCFHVFHISCISPWLASHVTCPTCRTSLEHKDGSLITAGVVFGSDPRGNQLDDRDFSVRVDIY